MIRKIIKINKEKCNGCGMCATACHEGAITMIHNKATLTREDYCDGLGDCIPTCPVGAITFEEREAPEYNEVAVLAAKEKTKWNPTSSRISQWPVQIKLVPINAPYFDGANILIAADCTAYAYANFHKEFMHNHITLIGCPKLDKVDYAEKLAKIMINNPIKSITVVRMEVPCCGGIEYAVKKALQISGKVIPWRMVTISTTGNRLN